MMGIVFVNYSDEFIQLLEKGEAPTSTELPRY